MSLRDSWLVVSEDHKAGRGLEDVHGSIVDRFPDLYGVRVVPERTRRAGYSGKRMSANVFESGRGIVDGFGFPGAEFVHVLSGEMCLTDMPSGKAHPFRAGDYFVIPRGWKGRWAWEGFRESAAINLGSWVGGATSQPRGNDADQEELAVITIEFPAIASGTGPKMVDFPGWRVIDGSVAVALAYQGDLSIYTVRCDDDAVLELDGIEMSIYSVAGELGVAESGEEMSLNAGDIALKRGGTATLRMRKRYSGIFVLCGEVD